MNLALGLRSGSPRLLRVAYGPFLVSMEVKLDDLDLILVKEAGAHSACRCLENGVDWNEKSCYEKKFGSNNQTQNYTNLTSTP